MSLTLHYHPLASYCHKVLIALYEHGTPFIGNIVDLADEAQRAAHRARWPIGKMPVLCDDARGETVVESSIIIEYLDRYYPGAAPMIPADPDLARQTRLYDRVFDGYVMDTMSKIVTDKIRPPGRNDPHGVEVARDTLRTAYAALDRDLATRTWANGAGFSLADCAAAPALFYANLIEPLGGHRHLAAYHGRLLERPSY